MRIIAPDLALLATLSCATANSLYPAANLITQLRGETLRTTGVSAQVIRLERNAAHPQVALNLLDSMRVWKKKVWEFAGERIAAEKPEELDDW